MSDEWVDTISQRYIDLYEAVTGETFIREQLSEDEVYYKTLDALNNIN
jgi:phosphoribosylaminoimidazole-succinocarboxamide synthase